MPFKAKIDKNSPRFEWWMSTFGTPEVFVKQLRPVKLNIFGELQDAYLIELERLSAVQFEKLAGFLSQKWEFELPQMKNILRRDGCPVLAADVVVVFVENS